MHWLFEKNGGFILLELSNGNQTYRFIDKINELTLKKAI